MVALVCAVEGSAAAQALRFQVTNAAGGGPVPCQLVYVAHRGTGRAALVDGNRGRRVGDSVIANNRIFSATGSGRVPLPPGSYDLWIGRGPEWTLEYRQIQVVRGADTVVEARLDHVVDTGAWVSADFHVHAAPSGDSVTSLDARAVQAAAVGLDVLSSGDHNKITDYGPAIGARALDRWLAAVRGYELTTQRWGHFSVFPLPASAAGKAHVDLPVPGPSANGFFRQLRALDPEMVVIVNHPLSHDDSYFRNGGLDLEYQRGRPGFSFDFDAIEILNGYNWGNYKQLPRHLRLWFDLLDQGYLVAGVGSSDSHDLRSNRGLAGYPRTWLMVPDDRPDGVTTAMISRALKAGHATASTGPFLQIALDGKVSGDVVTLRDGRGRLSIDVQAAPWVSVARVTVFVDGQVTKVYPVAPSRAVRRFQIDHQLELTRDAHIVVQADGDRPLPPIAGEPGAPIPSVAVANPIFIDVDGNGRFDPSRRRPQSAVARWGRKKPPTAGATVHVPGAPAK